MKKHFLSSLAMLLSVLTMCEAAEFRNFGDMTLSGEGEKKFQMKEGRIVALKEGKRYKLSFELIKAPKIRNAHISVYCYLREAGDPLKKPKLYSLVSNVGSDIPADGKTYLCETVFSVPATPGIAEQVRIAAYNSYAPKGAEVVFRNLKIEESPPMWSGWKILPPGNCGTPSKFPAETEQNFSIASFLWKI